MGDEDGAQPVNGQWVLEQGQPANAARAVRCAGGGAEKEQFHALAPVRSLWNVARGMPGSSIPRKRRHALDWLPVVKRCEL